MRIRRADHRALSLVLGASLSAMILLSSSSSIPTVAVRDVPSFEDGEVVRLVGLVVDIVLYDTGSEGLVLADAGDGATIKVICSQGDKALPSRYLVVGDEACASGEVSNQRTPPVVFASSDDIELTRESESALSVALLSAHWSLFEGDRLRISGMVVQEDQLGSYRLTDPDQAHSIELRSEVCDFGDLLGKRVTVNAVLRLDPNSMVLFLADAALA